MASAVMATYARAPIVFSHGRGSVLFARDGRRYLDFAAGIAVCSLGHAHPRLVAALGEQASRLWHCSNLFEIEGQERLASRLAELSFGDVVFFGNSGAEANECAIKLARRHHAAAGRPERWRILGFDGSFHGRTLATLAAAGNPRNLENFGPAPPGFDHAPYGDLDAAAARIGRETAAILVEPIQGDGGIRVPPPGFLAGLRALADRAGALLMFDEVQSGIGRSGRLFAH
ncbi:MAG: aminotransferase class III-fold pyridoxal phosphate-dependent enzyme, partial [Alphaproteobacteria bacterium]|nr:aminotransferase class III-fold pyridoxal phosphate-dependent enzyme [Alphaproteobacteria bacterium]